MNIELTSEAKEKMREIAKDCNLPVERACEIILSQFATVTGGRVYTGRWREGNGLYFVVQWPFLTGLAKATGEELVKMTEVK
ncbi:MAG TPA: hypothetical protein VJ249_12065 [Candidatus Bathyarchaeia archaeon]|nr:hypothetical protein [Candidatus Bathyarchaeia archaeon]